MQGVRTIKAKENFKILVIDKEKDYYNSIKEILSSKGYLIIWCDNIESANDKLINDNCHIIISDIHIWHGNYSIRDFVYYNLGIEVIILARRVLNYEKSMAFDHGVTAYLDYYKDMERVVSEVEKIRLFRSSCSRLKEGLMKDYLIETRNEEFKKTLKLCEKVSRSKVNVLLVGESGVGKEVAARYIHICSNRCSNPFVPVNCSAFTETLLESELFGHEKGAYTGAKHLRKGRFEISNHGTLFLDEIGDVNLTTQVKLLRAIENKRIERIGSNEQKYIDFRLITATNKDLKEEVIKGNFREDFFYRISTIVIKVPPLRKRKEDLQGLIEFFLKKASIQNDIGIKGMEDKVKTFLYTYDYPGNIRELKNIIDRMVILSEDGIITEDGLPVLFGIKKNHIKNLKCDKILSLREYRKTMETKYIKWVLEITGGNVAEAARRLNVSTRHLFNKINEYKIR